MITVGDVGPVNLIQMRFQNMLAYPLNGTHVVHNGNWILIIIKIEKAIYVILQSSVKNDVSLGSVSFSKNQRSLFRIDNPALNELPLFFLNFLLTHEVFGEQ